MSQPTDSPDKSTELRRQGEEILLQKAAQTSESLTPEQARQVLHELQVHQIELEMQNEELRRTQAELDISRALYFDLYDLAPVGYCTITEQGIVLISNLTLSAMLGAARENLVKQPFSRFVLPEDQDIYYRYRKSLCATGTAQTFDLRLKKGIAAFWASLTMTAARDAKGNSVCRAVVNNVDERKRIEDDLRASEARFRSYFELPLHGIVISTPEKGWIDVNDRLCSILGYSRDEIFRTTWSELTHPDDLASDNELFDRILSGQIDHYTLDKRFVVKEGKVIWTRLAVGCVRKPDGRVNYLVAVLDDITTMKRAEQALLDSEAFARGILDSLNDSIAVIDSKGVVLAVNEAWKRFADENSGESGKPPQSTEVGSNYLEICLATSGYEYVDAVCALNGIHAVLDQKISLFSMDYACPSPTQQYWFSMRVTPLGQNGEGAVITHIDITELKNAKNWLEQLTHEQLAMLDNELVGIAKLRNHRIFWINRALETIFGYEPGELDGQSTRVAFLDDVAYEQFGEIAFAKLNEYGTFRTQIEMVRKDGEKLWIDIGGANLPGDSDESLWVLADITAIKRQQGVIEYIAYHDTLTGLPNRLLITDRLIQALAQAKREKLLLAVCYLDLDNFKPVNDIFGHSVGDRLLIEIARRLQTSIRANDTVGRLGGDEFVLLLVNSDNIDEYRAVLERVIETVSQPVDIDETHQTTVSASIGVSIFPQDAADSDILLRYADQAMFIAKQNGRNRCQFFDYSLERRLEAMHEKLERIQQGLASGEFRLYFQPKVDFFGKTLVGFEALIRWQHPVLGFMEPSDFLPAIENKPVALVMGEWVIRDALQQMQVWRREGVNLKVSVNVFAHQLHQPDFVENLRKTLLEYPDTPLGQLQIEITETAALPNLSAIQEVITDCQAMGVEFSIDDFGMGYSSLNYLRHLSAKELKIDKSFVLDMLVNREDSAIVESIIAFGRSFERSVIAEGVETLAHIQRLLELGCGLMQGYVIAHPIPSEDVITWVRGFRVERLLP